MPEPEILTPMAVPEGSQMAEQKDHTRHPAPPPGTPSLKNAGDQKKSAVGHIFFGQDGLRAGWSFVIFLLLTFSVSWAVNSAIRHFHLLPSGRAQQPMSPRRTIRGDGLNMILLVCITGVMSLIERRPFARYGLSLRRALTDFGAGLFWGFTTLSVLIAMLLVTHAIAFDGVALHGGIALAFGLKWALAFVLVGLFEEFFTRGYIQFTVARGVAGLTRYIAPTNRYAHLIGFWVAAFLFSVCLFMVGHLRNPGETKAGIAAVGLAGAVFAFSLYRTGTLWWVIGLHAAWDWAQTFFYGVSDSGIPAVGHLLSSHPTGGTLLSGGATGPEGSLLVIPTLLLIAVIIHFTLPRRDYPLTPAQAAPQREI